MEHEYDWQTAAELNPRGYCEVQNELKGVVFHGPVEELSVKEDMVTIRLKWVAQMGLMGRSGFGTWTRAGDEFKTIVFPNLTIPFVVEPTEKGKRIRFGFHLIYLEPQEESDARILSAIGGERHPPISAGTRVQTTQENPALIKEWSEEARAARKWGVKGIITEHHDGHGLYYVIQHEDLTYGCYDPSEIEVLK